MWLAKQYNQFNDRQQLAIVNRNRRTKVYLLSGSYFLINMRVLHLYTHGIAKGKSTTQAPEILGKQGFLKLALTLMGLSKYMPRMLFDILFVFSVCSHKKRILGSSGSHDRNGSSEGFGQFFLFFLFGLEESFGKYPFSFRAREGS